MFGNHACCQVPFHAFKGPPRDVLTLICRVGVPSTSLAYSVPASKPVIETCTTAPSRVQGLSLSAKKRAPLLLRRLSTSELASPRIPCVARSPAPLQPPPS